MSEAEKNGITERVWTSMNFELMQYTGISNNECVFYVDEKYVYLFSLLSNKSTSLSSHTSIDWAFELLMTKAFTCFDNIASISHSQFPVKLNFFDFSISGHFYSCHLTRYPI